MPPFASEPSNRTEKAETEVYIRSSDRATAAQSACAVFHLILRLCGSPGGGASAGSVPELIYARTLFFQNRAELVEHAAVQVERNSREQVVDEVEILEQI